MCNMNLLLQNSVQIKANSIFSIQYSEFSSEIWDMILLFQIQYSCFRNEFSHVFMTS